MTYFQQNLYLRYYQRYQLDIAQKYCGGQEGVAQGVFAGWHQPQKTSPNRLHPIFGQFLKSISKKWRSQNLTTTFYRIEKSFSVLEILQFEVSFLDPKICPKKHLWRYGSTYVFAIKTNTAQNTFCISKVVLPKVRTFYQICTSQSPQNKQKHTHS